MTPNERIEWRQRIRRALSCIKADGVSELTRRAGLIVVPVAASLACGYNANTYKKNASRQDYSTTTTTGAYTWNSPIGGDKSDEEEAERKEREERETAERQARAQQQQQPQENAPAASSSDERAAFAQHVKSELANIDSDVDDIRTRAAMAGQGSRDRVQPILKEIASRRAQLEQSRKALEATSGADWTRAHDDAQKLLDDVKARVRAARDAI